jgi:sec-independent protein translocase protein TatA
MKFSPELLFFNIGAPELFIIVLVVIIFFGSKKIPDLMKGLGKGMREFKNATGEIQREIRDSSQSIKSGFKDSEDSPEEKK